jgi:hypothetical protein
MAWLRGFGGGILLLLGLVWIGQGLNILRGAAMSGHAIYAIIGLVAVIVGAWLLWSLTRITGQPRGQRGL